ncbi:MAG: hypothetical protein IPJ20_19100 [Flammeovirgaceae bacterium]|nr:hypothetical protein [Flammeovirgaceae bacterium]
MNYQFSQEKSPRHYLNEEIEKLIEDDSLFVFPFKTEKDYNRECRMHPHHYLRKIHLLF